jgi:hypothetical protein
MRTKGVQGVFENKGHSLSCLAIYWRCSDGILVASYLYIDACSSQKSPNAKLHQSAFVHISCIYSVVYIMFVQFGLSRTACLHCSHHEAMGCKGSKAQATQPQVRAVHHPQRMIRSPVETGPENGVASQDANRMDLQVSFVGLF